MMAESVFQKVSLPLIAVWNKFCLFFHLLLKENWKLSDSGVATEKQ